MATDYLTCGQCLREFPLQCITLFIQHKKLDCDDESDLHNENPELKCNYCPQGFMTAWALLVHAQLTHNLKIFLEKASKSFLNQVKFLPGNEGSNSKEHMASNVAISDDKMCGTKGLQQRLNENSGASLLHEKDKSDDQSSLVNEGISQSVSGTSPPQSKMGSNLIVTKNILTGTKEVGEKTDEMQGNSNLDKNATRNSNVNLRVSSTPQITTSQKLSLFPINQGNVSFLPKLSVVPLSVSSGNTKSTSIQVLPTVLTRTLTQTSPKGTVKKATTNTVVNVLKTEGSPKISLELNDNQSSDNLKNTQDVSTISLPNSVAAPLPSAIRIFQPGTCSTEIFKSTDSLEGACVVTPLTSKPVESKVIASKPIESQDIASKPIESQSSETDTIVPKLEGSGDLILHTDQHDNQVSAMDCIENENQSTECCNRQGCGVTVIPGSHEDLQECCSAVLPKKRKRHMELKHMPFSWSSSRYARRKRALTSSIARSTSSQFMPKPTTGTIYIDLEPDSLNSGERSADGQVGTALKVTQSATSGVKILGSSNITVKTAGESVNQSKPHSLILKPGAIFSIPFTYTIPTSKSFQNTIALPVARRALSLAESGQQTGSNSSSNDAMSDLPKVSNADGNQSHISAQGILSNLDSAAEGQELTIERGKKDHNTGSKPFQCDKCTMAFNQRIHLKKHMSKHTGIKPYKCGECNYSTVERSHLKVHIRIHTGEKPFKCTYCEYATAQNSTLKIHLKRHHGGRMFQCKSCDKQFTQEEQLKGHKLEHGTMAMTSTEEKIAGEGISTVQETTSITQSTPPVTHPSSTLNSSSEVSSRCSSSVEVLASQTTNQLQESGHVDNMTNISQSG